MNLGAEPGDEPGVGGEPEVGGDPGGSGEPGETLGTPGGATGRFLERISPARSFTSKLLLALLGSVVLVVGVSLLTVRSETSRQLEAVARQAADQARQASVELEELRRIELRRLGRVFTESRRTLALIEAVLESGDPGFRSSLLQEIEYEVQLRQLETALVAFTDSRGRHAFTLLEGGPAREEDLAGVEDLAVRLLREEGRELTGYREVEGALYGVQAAELRLAGPPIGTVILGLPVSDRAPQRIGDVVGSEVCFVVTGRCLVGTGEARGELAQIMEEVAGETAPRVVRVDGRRWELVSDPLTEGRPEEGWRVLAIPLDDVLAPFHRISRVLTGVGAAAILLSLLLSVGLSRGLTRPVRALVEATRRVARGEYDTEVEVRSRDELGDLARSFNEMAQGLLLKERYRGILNKVVSREVAEELLQGEVELGGENRTVTTLFADVRGFTSLTEGMEPQEVIALLNQCMTLLGEAVETEGGVVDKYVGDELMALFGAPVTRGDDPLRAVRAARRMRRSVRELNRRREESGEVPVGIGVGISTGTVVAGNMGSPERLNYTVLGEAVNLAARLCQGAGPGEILVSRETARWIEVQGEGRIGVSSRGDRRLKGFSRPVEVFAVEEDRPEDGPEGAPEGKGGRERKPAERGEKDGKGGGEGRRTPSRDARWG